LVFRLQFNEHLGQKLRSFSQKVAIEIRADLAQVVQKCNSRAGHCAASFVMS